jgi:hypothetical protein
VNKRLAGKKIFRWLTPQTQCKIIIQILDILLSKRKKDGINISALTRKENLVLECQKPTKKILKKLADRCMCSHSKMFYRRTVTCWLLCPHKKGANEKGQKVTRTRINLRKRYSTRSAAVFAIHERKYCVVDEFNFYFIFYQFILFNICIYTWSNLRETFITDLLNCQKDIADQR